MSRAEIATILGIPAHLVRPTGRDTEHDGELRISYLKYQTVLQAVATMARNFKDGEWKGKRLSDLEVVDLVISRSMWYSHYKTMFPKLVESTLACQAHQEKWQRFQKYHRTRQLSGYRRAQRHSDDSWPWMAEIPRANNDQPHDQDIVNNERRDCFIPSRTYCVETICAPCGVVVAWANFPKAESPTNILNFLEQVYPTEESQPSYICVDKACLVLRTSVSNGSWTETWSKTSRFIVDSYHYTNHSAGDNLCRRYCNPTPRDGSNPNLVVKQRDQYGQTYYKNAFNTQACEQLNQFLEG